MKYIYWKDGKFSVGYLVNHPHYWTQGTDSKDLEDHLRDIYEEVTQGNLPNDGPDQAPDAMKVGELVV